LIDPKIVYQRQRVMRRRIRGTYAALYLFRGIRQAELSQQNRPQHNVPQFLDGSSSVPSFAAKPYLPAPFGISEPCDVIFAE
jgi:hypothetical protein